MKVMLLDHVVEHGGIKMARRHRQADGSYRVTTPFTKGAIIDMSDKSAQKYISMGLARELNEGERLLIAEAETP